MTAILNKIIGGLEKFVSPTSRVFNNISAALLLIMPLPVFIDVVSRLTFKGSIPGGIEIEEFFMVFIVYLAIAFTQFSDGHIRIEFLLAKFPKWVQNICDSFVYLLSLLFFILMSSQLIRQGIEKIRIEEVSYALEIPIWIFRFVAALGAILIVFVVLLDFLKALQRSMEDRRLPWLIPALILACFLVIAPMAGLAPTGLEGGTMGVLGMCLLFVLLFLGMPIGFGMGLTGFLGMIAVYNGLLPALSNLGIASYNTAASYMLTVVPLFVLMGEFAYHSGISQDLFRTANIWLGRLPGGLAFSAVCGDSLATAVTMGTLAVPEMKKQKYGMRLATGCLAAGGTLGILIPPSVGFIFYAIVTEESIGRLFIAGMVPGLLLAGLFMVTIYIIAKIRPELAPRGEITTFKEKLVSLKGVIGMLMLFVLILGGILSGIFSPVEGGAIGSVGAFVYAAFRGRVNRKMIRLSLEDTLKITTKLLMILIGVGILGYFLAATRLPFALAEFVTEMQVNRYVVFAAVIILFMVLGCLLNVIPMILLVLPTIFPSIVALGFDPIWFGVVTVLTMEMGQITPPIGVNVFAIGSVAKDVPMQDIFRGIVPFLICMIVCVVLLVIFPQIALFLPNLVF
ncbi:MAG: TRAP transporter large permease subunit [Deltaproteobacteria bacterium]|nr:TRAP transporter large permease subunit [Deltaproteobacteria bacterium]